jgi:hypothetical protein
VKIKNAPSKKVIVSLQVKSGAISPLCLDLLGLLLEKISLRMAMVYILKKKLLE